MSICFIDWCLIQFCIALGADVSIKLCHSKFGVEVQVVDITSDMVAEARQLANSIGRLGNSITKGDGNLAGCIGEVAVRDFLNSSYGSGASIAGDYDYDLITRKNQRIEVKTKRCTSVPQPHYECSVAMFNHTQNCDFYVFTRVSSDKVYLLGFLPREEFTQKAKRMIKGQKDRNIVNGQHFKFHADCLNVKISDLKMFKRK